MAGENCTTFPFTVYGIRDYAAFTPPHPACGPAMIPAGPHNHSILLQTMIAPSCIGHSCQSGLWSQYAMSQGRYHAIPYCCSNFRGGLQQCRCSKSNSYAAMNGGTCLRYVGRGTNMPLPTEVSTKSRSLLQESLSLPSGSRQAWEQGLAVTTPAATWAAWTVLADVPTAAAHSHPPPFGVRHRRRRRRSAALPARASRKATRHQRGFAAAGQACAPAQSAAVSQQSAASSSLTTPHFNINTLMPSVVHLAVMSSACQHTRCGEP